MKHNFSELSLVETYKEIMTKVAKRMVEKRGHWMVESGLHVYYYAIEKRVLITYNNGSRSFRLSFYKHRRENAQLSVEGIIGRQEANKLVYEGFKTLYEKV